MRRLPLLLLVVLFCLPTYAQTQDAKAMAILDHARSISGLTVTGLPAYRIEASFETFDDKGQQDGIGTVVQTGLPDGRIKRAITYRGRTSTRLYTDAWHEVSDEDYLGTFMERRLLDAVFDPVPPAIDLAKRTVTLQQWKPRQVQMQCAIVSVPVPSERNSHAVLPSNAYCIDDAQGVLRVIAGHGNYNTVLNSFRKLDKVYVAGDVSIVQGNLKRGTLHVEKFQTDSRVTAADMVLPTPTEGQVDSARTDVDRAVMAGSIVQKTTPTYPETAKRQHISGTVTLNAIIGRNGSIRDLEVLTAPDDSLAKAAYDAVKTWRYKPYTTDGRPAEVYTIITVNFSFGY